MNEIRYPARIGSIVASGGRVSSSPQRLHRKACARPLIEAIGARPGRHGRSTTG